MALKTDDEDIRDVRMYMEHGNNGDFYLNLYDKDKKTKDVNCIQMRMSMSGGNAPHEVQMAFASLYRAMKEHGLNNHPLDDK